MTMKTTYWVSIIVVAGLLAFAGCGKSDKTGTKPIISGETVLQEFKQVFPAPTPEQQKNIFKVSQGIRYRHYPDALAALEGLDSDTSLTEPQKKAVADLRASIQQSITNAPPAAPR